MTTPRLRSRAIAILTLASALSGAAIAQEGAGGATEIPLSVQETPRSPYRFYVGGGAGLAFYSKSAAEVERHLADFYNPPPASYTVDMDSTSFAYKIYGGVQVIPRLAVELGWTNLGAIDARVTPSAGSPTPTQEELKQALPRTGAGPTLAVRASILNPEQDVDFFARLGAFAWTGSVDANVANVAQDADKNGFDLFVGLGLGYRIADNWSISAEWERYKLSDQHNDMITLNVRYLFATGSGSRSSASPN